MFAHQSALTSNNTSSGRYSKRGQVRHLLNRAELAARARNWALAKTYANNELRLKWKRPHKAPPKRVADGGFDAGGQPAESTLVYNDKVQHGLGNLPSSLRRGAAVDCARPGDRGGCRPRTEGTGANAGRPGRDWRLLDRSQRHQPHLHA